MRLNTFINKCKRLVRARFYHFRYALEDNYSAYLIQVWASSPDLVRRALTNWLNHDSSLFALRVSAFLMLLFLLFISGSDSPFSSKRNISPASNYQWQQDENSEFNAGTHSSTLADSNTVKLDKGDWWDENYLYRRQLTITNNSGNDLAADTTISVNIDTSNLESVQGDCDDLRIVYLSGATNTELARHYDTAEGATDCSDSKSTIVYFSLQSAISNGQSAISYYLYYGNGSTSTPSNPDNAFDIGSKDALLTVPFLGDATGAAGETPSTSTGAIRYSGGKSALSFDGSGDYVDCGNASSLQITGNITIEAWIHPSDFNAPRQIVSKSVTYKAAPYTFRLNNTTGTPVLFRGDGATYQRFDGTSPPTLGQWNHLVVTMEGTTVTHYLNGAPNGSGTLSTTIADGGTNLLIGKRPPNEPLFKGLIDEVAIYNRALTEPEIQAHYNGGSPAPIVPDSNTVGLWHFDENGDDPRNSGKALDVSGNGNHGTINGAKYISGLVGVVGGPTAQSSQLNVQSYASHPGVFIEEGTTNRVPNPSFENNITDSWAGKSDINFTSTQQDVDGNFLLGNNNVNDVYFYDTTQDSDGGAWRSDATAQASSWYSEAFSSTRGHKNEFPEKAYLVATDSTLDIIDAVENKLWMRFNSNTNNALRDIASNVFVLNGKIYVGNDNNYGLFAFNFTTDFVRTYRDAYGTYGYYNGTISQRNDTSGWSPAGYTDPIVNRYVNDVHAAVISGKTYAAVATDGGVSVINETDETVSDNTQGGTAIKAIHLLTNGNMYWARTGINRTRLYYIYDATGDISSSDGQYISTSIPAIINGHLADLFVTGGTSVVDGSSNTIYVAGASGLSILQEKQGDETNSSVKYYTKDYITEEMVGDIRGMYGFWDEDADSTLANGDTVSDLDITGDNLDDNESDLTVVDGGGTAPQIVDGVRGKAIQFDGSNDYLKQKVYEDETGANWGPTYHGLSLADGAAFVRTDNVDLSPYASAANNYMIVIEDTEGDVAWGYIDEADVAEALGSELLTNGDLTNWTGDDPDNWSVVNEDANNYVTENSGAARIVSDLTSSVGLRQVISTTVGKLYKIQFNITDITAGQARFSLSGFTEGSTYTNYDSTGVKTVYFTAESTSAGIRFYRWNGGPSDYTVDDVTVKEVTDVGTDGVHIMSTKGGSTQNWASISDDFDYNDSSYTFEVRKTDFQITGDKVTVGAWVKTSDNYGRILEKDNGTDRAYNLNITASRPNFGVSTGGTMYWQSESSTIDSGWHFIAGVYNGSSSILYLDGANISSEDVSGNIDDVHPAFTVATEVRPGDSLFNQLSGTIDEPFITAEALSTDQIQDMFEKGCRAMGGTPGTGTCTGIDESSTTNTLAGSTNIVNAVWAPSTSSGPIVVGTDGASGAVSVIQANADSQTTYFDTGTSPALVNNDTSSLSVVGSDATTPTLIVGSDANGVSALNDDLVSETQNTGPPYYKFGSGSLKLDNSGSALDSVYSFNDTLSANPFTLSFYAYTDGNQVTSSDIIPFINTQEGLSSVAFEESEGGWTRIYADFTGETTADQNFGVQVKSGKTVYVDGVQLEQKSYPTSYADGSLGTGYSWNGTAHNSTSTRSDTNVQYTASSNISDSQGALSVWIKPNWNGGENAVMGNMGMVFDLGNQYLYVDPLNDRLRFRWGGCCGFNTSTVDWDHNEWKHIVAVWNDNGTNYVYADGIQKGSEPYVSPSLGNTLDIGSRNGNNYFLNGAISDLRIYDSALTSDEVTDLYYAGLSRLSAMSSTDDDIYPPSGTFTSSVLDTTKTNVTYRTISWNQTIPGSTGLTAQVRSAENSSMTENATSWTNVSNSSDVPSTLDGKRYFQYRVNFTSTDQVNTPTFSNISLVYEIGPDTPTNFTGTVLTTTSIQWSWTDNADNENSYYVEDQSGTRISSNLGANASTWTETDLLPNTQYTRHSSAVNASGEGESSNVSVYTLANTPGTPTVERVDWTILKVTTDTGGNPAHTQFTIYETITGKYVQADGTLGDTPAWQTYDQWGGSSGKLVIGLIAAHTYTFQVKARNGDGAETSAATSASQLTYGQTFDTEPGEGYRTYTVQPGDTLVSIAQDIFGDWTRYTELIELNKDRYPSLLTNPGYLEVGWELVVSCQLLVDSEKSDEERGDEDSTTIEAQMDQEGYYTVKVKVVDTKENLIRGATVTLHSDPKQGITDGQGEAIFEDVEAGEHRIVVAYNGKKGEQEINLEKDSYVKEVLITIRLEEINSFPWGYAAVFALLILIIVVLSYLLLRKRRT